MRARLRLRSQLLVGSRARDVTAAVAAMAGVQGQDLEGAKWSIGLRAPASTVVDVERAFAQGSIVRTWPMRGTLHVVAAEDVRWLLSLTAKGNLQRAAYRHRQLELDAKTFAKSHEVLARVLEGKQLTREELVLELERAKISAAGQRAAHLLWEAAVRGLICSGAPTQRRSPGGAPDQQGPERSGPGPKRREPQPERRATGQRDQLPAGRRHMERGSGLARQKDRAERGDQPRAAHAERREQPGRAKTQTFALLDEWVPRSRALSGDEALAELARRYFTTRGPATVKDFTWWSGLPARDAKRGLELVSAELERREEDGKVFWSRPGLTAPRSPTVLALPGFDELLLGYQDRSAVLEAKYAERICPGGNGMFLPTLVFDGRVVGTWRRATRELTPFKRLSRANQRLADEALARYATFLGKED